MKIISQLLQINTPLDFFMIQYWLIECQLEIVV